MLNPSPVSDEESVVSETPARKKKAAPKRTPLNNISSNPYPTEKESWPTLEASDSDSGTDISDNAYEEDNIADMGDWVDDRSNDDETQFEQSQTYEQPRSGREPCAILRYVAIVHRAGWIGPRFDRLVFRRPGNELLDFHQRKR